MKNVQRFIGRGLSLALALALCANFSVAQATASLHGDVIDEFGAVIVGATVTLIDAKNAEKTVTTNQSGSFVFTGLAAGKYFLRVIANGFALYEQEEVAVAAGPHDPLRIKLAASLEKQKVTVEAGGGPLSTDPDANTGAVVIKGKDLDALPDDPDDLAAALQAMAGGSAGPNGGQLYVDGFSGSSMPPKEAIREIRINSNPFAAENDRIGFGRIEILTKPGVDKYHGSAAATYNNQSFNSRNPFVDNKPKSSVRFINGSFSGPVIAKRASFFTNFSNRDVDDNANINATILDPSLNVVTFSQGVVVPRRSIEFSPRFDYQLNKNNTMIARYSYDHTSIKNAGIGGFTLPSQASTSSSTEHSIQFTETAILSPRIVNETRFQFQHNTRDQVGDSSIPSIIVSEAFNGGGANVGLALNNRDRVELQNYSTWAVKTHTVKFGARMRWVRVDDVNPANFAGTYVFFGGVAPLLDANNHVQLDSGGDIIQGIITSLESYRRTLLFQQQGLSAAEIGALGGEPSQLSIAGGDPEASVRQLDVGGFFQDDWRIRPGFTLSYGLRYEAQTNISSNLNFAPRVSFAWSPGASAGRQSKTVFRGGTGIFYERAAESLTLQANRANGINQQQFTVTDPTVLGVFPRVPAIETLSAFSQSQNIYRVSGDLTAPYTIQSSISVERQLPYRTTFTATYLNARGVHYLRARNINAPLPGTVDPLVRGSGVRPFGDVGNIFEYESSGIFKQNQMIFNVQNRFNRYVTVAGTYVLGWSRGDTDGAGTLPANTYDLRDEFGRSSFDVRHRAFIFGSITLPWHVTLSPLIFASSGAPFNITTGVDTNGDSISRERPAFATDLSRASVKVTPLGAFDLDPLPGAQLIPRNFGDGPASFTVNLRVSRTFGFGGSGAAANAAAAQQTQGQAGGGRFGQGFPGGGRPGGGEGGQGGGGRGPGGGGPGLGAVMFGGGGASDHPYNLTISVNASNLFNRTNASSPVGNLSSPFFGQSLSLGGGGFGGGPGGFGGGTAANNRRIDVQLRFNF